MIELSINISGHQMDIWKSDRNLIHDKQTFAYLKAKLQSVGSYSATGLEHGEKTTFLRMFFQMSV